MADDSKFVEFLNETCIEEKIPDDIAPDATVYSVKKIRCFAILYCTDDADEKISELWNMMQDSDQPTIAAYDKDFESNLFMMLDISTFLVLQYEEQFTGC